VSAETLATFREAVSGLRRGCDFKLDDDAVLLTMARHLLGGPTDEGRASYQVAISICPRCGIGAQRACGELVEVEAEVTEMVRCDAQHIGPIDDAHVGVRKPATQTIPPATRRKVLWRDRKRCVVPGCKHTHFVDVHHIDARAEGGDHDEDNLVTLCAAHHRAVHSGRLIITGRPSRGLVFRHADGTSYGASPSPKDQDLYAKLFAALCGMGFGEKESRQALERARSKQPGENDPASLLRTALAQLTALA